VWKDFPRQKMLTNEQGKPNLLLNYLTLTKKSKRKQYFVQTND